ncbi:ankyrin repeat-containing domain protein, partial [Baffinella frigidus]
GEVGDTLLHSAASGGHVNVLRELLARGALLHTRNTLGCTALHAAAMHGSDEAIHFLLDHGADPRESDAEGYCPMHYVCFGGSDEAIHFLLDHGADPRESDAEGYCPMHYAAGEGHVDAIQALVSGGRCVFFPPNRPCFRAQVPRRVFLFLICSCVNVSASLFLLRGLPSPFPSLSQKTSSKTRFLKSIPLRICQLILYYPHKSTNL